MLTDSTGRYNVGFLVAGMVALAGAGSWYLLVRRVEPSAWSTIEQKIVTASVYWGEFQCFPGCVLPDTPKDAPADDWLVLDA